MSQRKAIRKTLVKVVLAMMALSMAALFAVTVWGGYTRGWTWTGLGEYISPSTEPNQEYERAKTFWDWMALLIIPAVLATGALLFNQTERRAEREAAIRRDKTERSIADDYQREAALQAYLDKMTELLLEKELRTSEPDAEVRDVARARTLAVLPGLDGARKGLLLRFLHESQLIAKNNKKQESVIDLHGADLRGAHLRGAHLSEADLREVDLRGADLSRAYLIRTDLSRADLRGADLSGADLVGTNMSGTKGPT